MSTFQTDSRAMSTVQDLGTEKSGQGSHDRIGTDYPELQRQQQHSVSTWSDAKPFLMDVPSQSLTIAHQAWTDMNGSDGHDSNNAQPPLISRSAGKGILRDAIWRRRSDKKENTQPQNKKEAQHVRRAALSAISATAGFSDTRYEQGLGVDNPLLVLPNAILSRVASQQHVHSGSQMSAHSTPVYTSVTSSAAHADPRHGNQYPTSASSSLMLPSGHTYWDRDAAAARGLNPSVLYPAFDHNTLSSHSIKTPYDESTAVPVVFLSSSPLPPSFSSSSGRQGDAVKKHKSGKEKKEKEVERDERPGRTKRKGEDSSSEEQMEAVWTTNNVDRRDAKSQKRASEIQAMLKVPSFKSSNRDAGIVRKVVASKGCGVDDDILHDGTAGDGEEVRHQCPYPGCGKHYSTSGHARRHSRYHVDLRPFQCPFDGCFSTFTRSDNCSQHQRSIHAVERE
ncbi:hypothetical protein CBS101457_004942 [Exobasidium rhododendri]|nr:hypothetical protein CBS101457_004942 [Exobasidium rhododendri]